jgi:hypothetical protein
MEISPAPELPTGIVPLPELGDGVVGARASVPARRLLWVKGSVWGVVTVGSIGLTVQSIGAPVGLLLGAALVISCGFMALDNLLLAARGDRPLLTVDAQAVHCLMPLSRVTVRLPSITRVDRLRRDLLIEARGGIERRGRPTRARWVGIGNLNALEVSRADLIEYLQDRAVASRSPE